MRIRAFTHVGAAAVGVCLLLAGCGSGASSTGAAADSASGYGSDSGAPTFSVDPAPNTDSTTGDATNETAIGAMTGVASDLGERRA